MRPLRVALLLALVASPALAGCFGTTDEDAPRLAVPATKPPTRPDWPLTAEENESRKGPMEVNTSDPGYVIEGAWQKGDQWYYESLRAPYKYRWTVVMDVAEQGNQTSYIVEERYGMIGSKPQALLRLTVDGNNWTRLRAEQDGTTIEFSPPAANPRFLRNGSFEYNETATSTTTRGWHERHIVNSVYAGNQNIELPWGTVRAARIEHRDLIIGADGQETRIATIRWVNRDYLNDVAFEVDGERYYILAGARIGERQYGFIPGP